MTHRTIPSRGTHAPPFGASPPSASSTAPAAYWLMALVRLNRGFARKAGLGDGAGTVRTASGCERPGRKSSFCGNGCPDFKAARSAGTPHPAGDTAPIPWTNTRLTRAPPRVLAAIHVLDTQSVRTLGSPSPRPSPSGRGRTVAPSREPIASVRLAAAVVAYRRAGRLPLPEGEGWGEGEAHVGYDSCSTAKLRPQAPIQQGDVPANLKLRFGARFARILRNSEPGTRNPEHSCPPPQHERCVRPAETERIRKSVVEFCLSRLAHNRKGASLIGLLHRAHWWQPLLAQRHQANQRFHRPCRPEQMPDACFRRTHRDSRRVTFRPLPDRRRFRAVIQRRARPVGIQVTDLFRPHASRFGRAANGVKRRESIRLR